MKLSKKERTRLLLSVVAIIFLTITLFSNAYENVLKIYENNTKIDELEIQYQELIIQENILKTEVTKLLDEDYVARYAKERYFYSGENEVIFRFE